MNRNLPTIEDIALQLRRDRLTPVPEAVRNRALGRLRLKVAARTRESLAARALRAVERIASLVLDSAAQPALAGVRGGTASARQLVYEWNADRYALRIQRRQAAYDIMGQILRSTGEPSAVRVELRPEHGRARLVRSSTTGEFAFDAVSAGRYSLHVGPPEEAVTLPGVDLP